MPEIREKEKELRFTRSGQAVAFWIAGAACAMAGLTLLVVSTHRLDNPMLPHPAWALPPLLACCVFARLAYRLTHHAYLILSPLGIEIFPLFRPASGMQLVYWSQIQAVDVDDRETRLSLHYNAEKSAGIHISLHPIDTRYRTLLVRAVMGRLAAGRR